MIDEKKIEKAKEKIFEDEFELYSYDTEYPDGNIYRMFTSDQLKRAISFGAHWVISEFLKDLWHPASEEPENYKQFIYVKDTLETGVTSMLPSFDWKHFVHDTGTCKWLYIDDLLEQEAR